MLQSKSILTLTEAAFLLLGRTTDRYKSSPELKNTVQRMRDAKESGHLELKEHPWRVTRTALNEWAAHIDLAAHIKRGWAKNLGIPFRDQITCESGASAFNEYELTDKPAPRNLRASYDRVVAENEGLRARLATCEAEVQRLTMRRGRPLKKVLQKPK